MQDFHGRSSTGAYEPSTIYPEGSFSQLKSYASGELSGVPSVTDDAPSEAPQRMTPVQFGRPHISASFTHGGQLLMVLPKDPKEGEKAIVQLRDVQKMLCLDSALKETIQQMKNYPGPLTLADTHKEVVVKYCYNQVAEAANDPNLNDRESVVLIWEYLALLVKQNGKLFGSDIASLLLKGREVGSHPQQVTPNTTPDEIPNTPASDASPQDEGIDMHAQTSPPTAAKDESLILKKFCEYLSLGRKREAVDYAMREGLWGHALALSYKMDGTTHTRVLAAFSNSIPQTDVLQTLFQQLSGKRPEITKSYNIQQWGDWRQHLAMMVSNPTGHTQRDRASIVALGDTLASRGQLHAAHFCYLVAEAEWGTYSNKSSQLVLIGSSHNLPFQAFSTNEAIQCTEVYEFARSLDSSNPVLETFQSYKLIYALRLTEYGFPAEALRYCEVISQLVSRASMSYPIEFLSQVYELASRLKYHDLHYQMCEGELLEMPDPKWLSHLHELVETTKHKAKINSTEVDQEYAETHVSQNVSVDNYYHQAPSANVEGNEVQGTYHQDMITDEYRQGSHGSYHGHVTAEDTMDGGQQNSLPVSRPPLSKPSTDALEMPSMQNEMHQPSDGTSQPMERTTPQIPMMQPPQDQSGYVPYDTSYWSGYQHMDPHMTPFTQAEPAKEMSSLPPSSDVNVEQLSSSVTSFSQPNSISGYTAYQQPPYQPWEQSQETPTMALKPNDPQVNPLQESQEEEPHLSDGPGKKKMGGTNDEQKSDDKKNDKEGDKEKSQEKSNTWSISSIFGWKKSKQAILPDDKNPSIVWDEAKKKWVNQDGEEEVAAPPPPPPKSPLGGSGGPPVMKMRGLKKSRYVNTEKDALQANSGGMNPNLMMPQVAPPLPGSVLAPQFMVPEPKDNSEDVHPQAATTPQQDPQQPVSPQQQPPVALPPEVSQMRRSRYISESSIELEDDWPPTNTEGMLSDGADSAGTVPMMAPPSMQPQFFNPALFTSATSNSSHPARRSGPGRRTYPVKR